MADQGDENCKITLLYCVSKALTLNPVKIFHGIF